MLVSTMSSRCSLRLAMSANVATTREKPIWMTSRHVEAVTCDVTGTCCGRHDATHRYECVLGGFDGATKSICLESGHFP